MARLISQTLLTSPVVSGASYGDAYGSKVEANFGSALTSASIGNLGKASEENTTFLRFTLDPAAPAGAELLRWKLEVQFTISAPEGPSPLTTRLGCLIGDGKWEYSETEGGFKSGLVTSWHYAHSELLPHPTADGNDTIINNILVDDVFLGGGTGALIPIDYASSTRSFGEGYSGLAQVLTGSTAQIETALGLQGGTMLGFAWDVYSPDDTDGGNYAQIRTRDHSEAASPRLYLEYTLPGPGVTSRGLDLGGAIVTQQAIGSSESAVLARAGLEATVSLSVSSSGGPAVEVAGEDAGGAVETQGYAIGGD